MITIDNSNRFWAVKAIAIFSIFFAHLMWTGENDVGYFIYQIIGSLGVPWFMIMSGFFDYGSKTPLYRRLKNLFIPLLIWGTLTYILVIVTKRSDTSFWGVILNWLKWVCGCGTWLYFVGVLFFCLLFSRFINKWVLVFIGIMSMVLSVTDTIPYNSVFTPYNNPLNFFVYFQLGRLYREYWGDVVIVDKKLSIISIAIIVLYLYFIGIPIYWNPFTPIFTIASFIILWLLLEHLSVNNMLVQIGKISFVIYLCHLQIAQHIGVLVVSKMGASFFTNIIKIPIAFMAVVLFVICIEYVLKKIHCEKMLVWLGYR